jgi:Uncharacterized conserved protein
MLACAFFFTSSPWESAQMNSALHATDSGHQWDVVAGAGGRQDSALSAEISIAEAFPLLAAPLIAQVEQRVSALSASVDGENLHKLRVALRRLRTLWWAYEPYLNKKEARAHRRDLKSLADVAGQTRDWDILRQVLTDDKSMKHTFTTLLESIDLCRGDAFVCSRTTIQSAGADQMLQKRVGRAVEQLQAPGFDESLPVFARRRVDAAGNSLDNKFRRAVTHQIPEYPELHKLRIAGKRLRYLLEFFLPVLDDCDPANIKVLADLQDELGKLNDLVASEALLHKHAAELGKSTVVEHAIYYVSDQKVHCMQHVYELLHTVNETLAKKCS